MDRTFTTELLSRAGQPVRLAGWLHHQRQLANITFVLLRDGQGIAQVVIDDEDLRREVGDWLPESVIEVTGTAVESDQAPGGVEVHDPVFELLVAPTAAPPFELRRKTMNIQLPTMLDQAALSLRHPRRRAFPRITSASVAGFRDTLDARGFTEIHTPKMVGSATETGANVFRLDYFGSPGYLAQSPQFYKQTMVGALERVYEVGPVFRAEPHNTTRHLAEYTSLDVELGFIRDHTTVMGVLRDVLAGMVASVAGRAGAELAQLGIEVPAVPEELPALPFDEVQRMIEAATDEPVVGEPDLAPAHERWIGEWAMREHGSDFVFVTGYPMVKRPFYTHPDPARPEFSNSFDLIFRGIELVTGGQRLHRYDDYLAALGDTDLAPLDGYLAAFRHGMPPHGGFAIGLERWVARITGAENVREVTLFPRDMSRLSP